MRRTLNDTELATYLTAHASRYPRTLLAVELMLWTGLRIGEVRRLKWSHLLQDDTPRAELHLRIQESKNKTSRTIPLAPPIRSGILRHLLDHHPHHDADAYVFPAQGKTPEGRPLPERTLQEQIHQVGLDNLTRRITPHMFRHTFATRLLPHSNLRVVQAALGHRSITSTMIYTHPSYNDLSAAIDATTGLKPSPHPPTPTDEKEIVLDPQPEPMPQPKNPDNAPE